MSSDESIVFWTGAAIFAVSTLVFLALARRKETDKFLATSDIFVSFITAISYVIMALGIATVTTTNGQMVYYTRWLFYMAACNMLTADVAIINRKSKPTEILQIVMLTSLVMFCGFLASFITTIDRWWFFGFSSAAYIGLLYALFGETGKVEQSNRMQLMLFIVVFWTAFPAVFALAPTGIGILSTVIEAILYEILDVITKIGFGLWVTLRFKTAL